VTDHAGKDIGWFPPPRARGISPELADDMIRLFDQPAGVPATEPAGRLVGATGPRPNASQGGGHSHPALMLPYLARFRAWLRAFRLRWFPWELRHIH
jgi:hypothetical protein